MQDCEVGVMLRVWQAGDAVPGLLQCAGSLAHTAVSEAGLKTFIKTKRQTLLGRYLFINQKLSNIIWL